MALRRIALRDFVIVRALELDLSTGFTVLTGETGAGKSILIDALQLALGNRADAGAVREGAERLDVSAEFDADPALAGWLDEGGFEAGDALLLRRTVDLQGRSRGWINGSPATATQLRELGDRLLDIHGQHAWQSLTRPEAVRGLLDAYAGVRTDALDARLARLAAGARRARHRALGAGFAAARTRAAAMADRRSRQAGARRRRVGRAVGQPRAHLQCAGPDRRGRRRARSALEDDDGGALAALSRARRRCCRTASTSNPSSRRWARCWPRAWRRPSDAAHSLHGYLRHADTDPQRLAELDERMGLLDVAGAPLQAPAGRAAGAAGRLAGRAEGARCAKRPRGAGARRTGGAAGLHEGSQGARQGAQAGRAALAQAVTQAMQGLGMQGGRFEVALQPLAQPGRAGLEDVAFLVSGHAGSTPRADRQGGLGRRAVAHRAGHRRHDQRARRRADADLRRGRCRRRRRGGRDRRPADEAARPRPPGAGRDPPAAGGGLRRPPPAWSPSGRPRPRARTARAPKAASRCSTTTAGPRKSRACWAANASRRPRWRMRARCWASKTAATAP